MRTVAYILFLLVLTFSFGVGIAAFNRVTVDGTGTPGDLRCTHYVFGLQPDTTYVVYAGVDSSLVYHLRSGPAGDLTFDSVSASPVWISME